MPSLQITTNVKVTDVKAFVLEFSKIAAEALSKPEKYITIAYTYNEHLSFHGTFDPAFVMTVVSLDNINPEANEKYSKTFFGYFEKTLGTAGDRGYIHFVDPGRANLGYEHTTFETIFK